MKKLNIGVAGLGRAFSLMAPAFRDPRVALVAAADPREEARARFAAEHGGRTYATVEALCADWQVDVVYIASPHQFHAEHALLACAARKHVLVEKPMALTLAECRRMTLAAADSGVQLIVGHSHSFDAPVLRARALIDSGKFGRVRMISAINYTDFLYRPRRPEELDTARGGGAVYNQAAHQVDVARLLGGAKVETVRSMLGAWDPARPTEGAYSCLLGFAGGAFAHLTYSGYAHFDSDELMGWIGELGQRKSKRDYGRARRALRSASESALKRQRNYGGGKFKPARPKHHEHFGFLVVSCDKADLRPMPGGVMIYADGSQRLDRLRPPRIPRASVIDELHAAVTLGKPPLHGGRWATATLEVCLAMLRSAREGKDVRLENQSG